VGGGERRRPPAARLTRARRPPGCGRSLPWPPSLRCGPAAAASHRSRHLPHPTKDVDGVALDRRFLPPAPSPPHPPKDVVSAGNPAKTCPRGLGGTGLRAPGYYRRKRKFPRKTQISATKSYLGNHVNIIPSYVSDFCRLVSLHILGLLHLACPEKFYAPQPRGYQKGSLTL
jgi:hypothetical protein